MGLHRISLNLRSERQFREDIRHRHLTGPDCPFLKHEANRRNKNESVYYRVVYASAY
ncbi:hypothetical protein D3C72_2497500 [compost metagenome]